MPVLDLSIEEWVVVIVEPESVIPFPPQADQKITRGQTARLHAKNRIVLWIGCQFND